MVTNCTTSAHNGTLFFIDMGSSIKNNENRVANGSTLHEQS